jgi:excisionase family DNA binding protein
VANRDGSMSAAHVPAESAAPPYLTPAQVAELLQVCEKTVLRWSLEDASMPVLRRGGVVRFHRERLERWLERQEPRSARPVTQGPRKMADSAA